MAVTLVEGPLPGQFQVQPVDLTPEEEEKYVGSLVREIKDTLRQREATEELWKIAVQQYHGELKREDAEPGESELDMPSTREFADMAAARLINTVFARPEIYIAKPRRPEAREFAMQVEQFMDWALDRTEYRFFVEDLIRTGLVFTKAVAKVPYVQKTRKVMDYKTRGQVEDHWGAEKDGEVYIAERVVVEESRPIPELVPTQDFIHPIPCASIADAPWVCHRVWSTRDRLAGQISRQVYRSKTPKGEDVLKALSASSEGPALGMTLGISEPDEGAKKAQVYEVWEIYTTLDEQEVILTVDPESGVVLRFIYNFYFDFPRPFVTWCYERVPHSIDGISLCYLLEALHRARSACFNQRLDAASKAMESLVLFAESTGLGRYLKDGKIRSGAWPVNAVGDIANQVTQFQISHPFSPLEGIEATLERDMQKIASLTDYNAGLEQIQRPTASGQMALLEEGRQPMYSRMEHLREVLKIVGEMMLARYRQFRPVEVEYYIQARAPQDGQMVQAFLQWPQEYWKDELILETAVSSQSMSRDLRKQEWLALVDKMPQVFGQMMSFAQAAVEGSPLSPVAVKMLAWYTRYCIQPWLQEFEVAGSEFVDFGEEMQVGQMFAQMVQELQAQVEQLQGEVEAGQRSAAEAQGLLDHVTRSFVEATGRVPPPPPPQAGPAGPAQAAGGMGGGAAVPGGGVPGAGAGAPPPGPGAGA